jgi:uncharacterized membrane protein
MATSAVVIVLMAYRALAYPEEETWVVLDDVGWGVLVSAIAGFAISFALLVHARYLRERAETGASEMQAVTPVGPEPSEGVPKKTQEEPAQERPEPDLSRLSKDERRLYERIKEAGGEVLQMKLVASGEFSKSKVTRLLDRLESRGIIIRERSGMTNRVKIRR